MTGTSVFRGEASLEDSYVRECAGEEAATDRRDCDRPRVNSRYHTSNNF
jgi:hypothetical protein